MKMILSYFVVAVVGCLSASSTMQSVWQMKIQRAIERCGETRMSYHPHISDQTESGLGLIHRNTDLGTWPLDGVSKVEVCMDDGIVGGPGTGRDYPRPFPTFIF